MITRKRIRLGPIGLCLMMLSAICFVTVTTSPSASAYKPVCNNSYADPGFGVRRACKYDTTNGTAAIRGTATWYYDSGQAANTGVIAGVITASSSACVYMWFGTELEGKYLTKACGSGTETGFNYILGKETSPADGYRYKLKLCTARIQSTCKKVWTQLIGQAPPI